MKKFLSVLILFFMIQNFAIASTEDTYTSGDMTDLFKYSDRFENPFAGQKQITNEEFDKTVNQIKEKQNKKAKKKNPQLKGNSIKDTDESKSINETGEKYIILSLPTEVINGDGTIIPIGYYRIIATKEDGKCYLDFFQSRTKIARVPAIETNSDFGEKEVNFVKIIPYDEKRLQIIYGSIDYNAYSFLRLKY